MLMQWQHQHQHQHEHNQQHQHQLQLQLKLQLQQPLVSLNGNDNLLSSSRDRRAEEESRYSCWLFHHARWLISPPTSASASLSSSYSTSSPSSYSPFEQLEIKSAKLN